MLVTFSLKALLGSTIKAYAGIKMHAVVNHVHQQILLYGSPRYIDTVRFEHQHAIDGVAAAAMTSKRPTTLSGELLVTVLCANKVTTHVSNHVTLHCFANRL